MEDLKIKKLQNKLIMRIGGLLLLIVLLMTSCGTKERIVAVETEFGTMKFKLYDETPKHRDNFIKLAEQGFYDGLLFHRVISEFMIQGGDPESKNAGPEARLGGGGPGYQIPAEFGKKHVKGALAAARRGDAGNPEKESSGSQFYIVQGKPVLDQMLDMQEKQFNFKYTPEERAQYKKVGGTPFLDGNYTVFGEIIEGMDVIDKIAAVSKKPGDRPVNDIKMKVKVVK